MTALSYSAAFITFFSVVGPPKVLLAFAGLAQIHPTTELRRIALISSSAAILVGLVTGIASPWLLDLFHISTPALQVAGGVIFFIYAVGLVLGVHLGTEASGPDAPDLVSGVRQLLMPYVVSPLAMTAVLIEGAARDSWTWRSTVVGAYVTVIVIDLLCVVVLARILSRTHHATIELLGRLLGLLLAAVGVDLVLDGLTSLGVPADRVGH
ncbi:MULTISPECIES: MarC family protein [unclassified Streptomyces]|uniref:MarC family protein n=1 Tax=unclassified Streptomyces TaxID=2593676 RepID=UPI00136B153A|nr:MULTISPECIES: MarC family protein [unclassified Streptomyces]NEA05415.1 MarC family protein [Streptomyces sp. SID10116]MYY87158.1 MarC family protein [Streptomyces sp. SID335]MYZ18756.1 MarC family protein [Streptomyces sp. SID337]NDZ87543.1 MarC family protein [Streptomyces sp. SID10115]NEB47697.1 MarC family protein [Streptomyces sp. SID339]